MSLGCCLTLTQGTYCVSPTSVGPASGSTCTCEIHLQQTSSRPVTSRSARESGASLCPKTFLTSPPCLKLTGQPDSAGSANHRLVPREGVLAPAQPQIKGQERTLRDVVWGKRRCGDGHADIIKSLRRLDPLDTNVFIALIFLKLKILPPEIFTSTMSFLDILQVPGRDLHPEGAGQLTGGKTPPRTVRKTGLKNNYQRYQRGSAMAQNGGGPGEKGSLWRGGQHSGKGAQRTEPAS